MCVQLLAVVMKVLGISCETVGAVVTLGLEVAVDMSAVARSSATGREAARRIVSVQ